MGKSVVIARVAVPVTLVEGELNDIASDTGSGSGRLLPMFSAELAFLLLLKI